MTMTVRQRIAAASHAAGRAIDKLTPWAREIEKAEAYQAAIDRLRAEASGRRLEPDAGAYKPGSDPARHPDRCDPGLVDELGQCPHLAPLPEEPRFEPDDAVDANGLTWAEREQIRIAERDAREAAEAEPDDAIPPWDEAQPIDAGTWFERLPATEVTAGEADLYQEWMEADEQEAREVEPWEGQEPDAHPVADGFYPAPVIEREAGS